MYVPCLSRRAPAWLVAGTLVSILIAACSPPSAAPAAGAASIGSRLVIAAHDTMRFEPATLTVDAGTPIQVALENKGVLVHDVTFAEGVSGAAVKVVAPGKTSAVSRAFTFEQPGTYRFVCAQPGHEAAGMAGTLVVQ